jgi:hypothetical protein
MLSPHFALSELTVSQTAVRRGIDNTPDEKQTDNLRLLADTLEQVRAILNKPVTVNSAFRSKEVNRLIGGVDTSEHCDGRAADIICPAYGSPHMVAMALLNSGLEFNQLILEFGSWVHISIPALGHAPKMQVLTYRHGKPVARGIVK